MKRVIRRRQTVDAAIRLEEGIRGWVKRWREDDGNEALGRTDRHHTHLNAIESVLGGAATALSLAAGAIAIDVDEGLVYQHCREVDETVAWLYRLWDFYRRRLDQRRDPDLQDIVVASDEIVWSAYSQVMAAPAVRRAKIPHGPAPLPYIHDDYSPAAIDQSHPLPAGLRMPVEFPAWDAELSSIVGRLAVPLLEVPRWCVGSPWWLIFVAHEVGHHLNTRLALLDDVQPSIFKTVAERAGASAAREWAAWTEEVLADAWSIVLVGRSAAEALAEIELSASEDMRQMMAIEYPPSALRLALMGRLSVALGLGSPTLPAVTAAAWLEADADLKPHAAALDAIAGVLAGALPRGLGTLASLGDVPAATLVTGSDGWSVRLRHRQAAPVQTLSAARLVVAGCFQAWQSLKAQATETAEKGDSAKAVETFTSAARQLAQEATTRLAQSGPPGTRAATQPKGAGADQESATALAQRLLALARHGGAAATPPPAATRAHTGLGE